MIKKLLIAVALLIATLPQLVQAEQLELSLLGLSHHTNHNDIRNNNNYGVVARYYYDNDNWYATTGGYYNSLYKLTVMSGVGYMVNVKGPIRASMTIGMATGYQYPIIPAGALGVHIGPLDVYGIPDLGNDGWVYTVGLTIPIGE